MPFGDRMAMGEGLAANLSCGHPHVEIDTSQFNMAVTTFVTCPLCGQQVQGSLRKLPQEEKPHE